MKFTIETVSKMTGIPAPSLRNWEKRYGFPTPDRTAGGHRYYSDVDVEFLRKAVHWIEEGQSLNEVARLYHQQLSQEGPVMASAVADDVSYRVQLIYEALLKFDQMATLQHYATLNAKLSVEQLFDRVFETSLQKISKDWELNRISAAQERFATAFLRLKLSTFLSLDFPPTQRPRILAATLASESSEGNLMVTAAHLKFRGYPVYYFGTGLPLEELKVLLKEIEPDVIFLTYENASALVQDSKALSQLKVPICFGGAALFQVGLKNLLSQHPSHFYFCQKATGTEAAQFVEMICQSKALHK